MRVISGIARGMRLKAVDGLNTRPTSDRIKENLFNMLSPDIDGSIFLDLFSGTGAIGIEALSRGAGEVVFVDNKMAAIDVIKLNLNTVKLSENARVLFMDFKTALDKFRREGLKFDIIFMDPPYRTELVSDALDAIAAVDILNTNGYVVAEVEKGLNINSKFTVYKSKDYASTSLIFLKMG